MLYNRKNIEMETFIKRRKIKALSPKMGFRICENPLFFNGLKKQRPDYQREKGLLREIPLTRLDKDPPTALHR